MNIPRVSMQTIESSELLNRVEAAIRAHIVSISMGLILLLGALLRFTGRNWDLGHYLHPDERFITSVAVAIHWPGLGGYFDSVNSTLNPYNNNYGTFIYGTFPLFLDKLWGNLTGNAYYGNFHLASRSLSSFADLLTILLVFLVARRLFDDTIGLIAALFYSLSALSIQLSHFGTFDTIVTTTCIATFWFALRANDSGRWWDFALTGLMGGLAISSKLSALPILAVAALPLIEQIRVHGEAGIWNRPHRKGIPALLGLLLAIICAVWTFRIAQPYAFLGPSPFSFRLDPRWTNDLNYWRAVQSGDADGPPSVQWANRTPLVFLLKNYVVWGVGPALGIASLAGLMLGGWRILTSRRLPPAWLLVLVGWPAFHLVYYGIGFIKTMRYVIPAYPFLAILAAVFLVGLARWAEPRLSRWSWLSWTPLAAVVLLTAAWAFAFSSIYTRPITRLAASEWIYQNIPAGEGLLNEHWDDPLPYGLPGTPGIGAYSTDLLPNYYLDEPDKLKKEMMPRLDATDYIILSSNRLYGSIPRIPERYPMTIEYYRMLFSGELGFKLVKTFTSRPELFGIQINDDHAEESFTVYDHPKVLIFEKTDAYDSDAVESHLATFLDQDIVDVPTIDAGYNMLQFDDATRAEQQAGGTWSEIFHPDSLANRFPAVFWYLALQLLALATVPWLWRLLPRMPDRGYALSKAIGLLFASFVAWFLASVGVATFGRMAVLAGLLLSIALSVLALGRGYRTFALDIRSRWKWIVAAEVVFLLAFVAFALIRSANPDLWHPARGGEKPMEFAYFNAITKSSSFPPYDPWFAGGYINYYYFGYVLMASITRLTGIVPEVAFNLSVVTCFALTVVLSWSFVASSLYFLRRQTRIAIPWKVFLLGGLGPLFVAIMGNLDMARRIGLGELGYPPTSPSGRLSLGTFGDIVRGLWRAATSPHALPTDAYWTPTRVIDGTINEFPYFSFLFADLHAHMMSIPFALTALLLALGILSSRAWPPSPPAPPEPNEQFFLQQENWRRWFRVIPESQTVERLGLVLLASLVVGALYPMNTWDYPTFLIVVGASYVILECLGSVAANPESDDLHWNITYATVRRAILQAGTMLLLGRLLFFPYFSHYLNQANGFEPWLDHSPTIQYLIIFGGLLFLAIAFCATDLWHGPAGSSMQGIQLPFGFNVSHQATDNQSSVEISLAEYQIHRFAPTLTIGMSTVLAVVSVTADHIVLLFTAMALLVGVTAWFRRHDSLRLFLLGLLGLGIAISTAVEFYALRGDVGRMNTVFKFYLQVWTLLGLAGAIGIVLVFATALRGSSWLSKAPWAILTIVLIGASLVYPALATPARIDDRFGPTDRTLNGMAYMDNAVFFDGEAPGTPQDMYLIQDKEAIEWIRENIDGSPVILEAVTPLYRWGSRYSVYTGLPTVIGWDWHQTQQRPGYQTLIDERKNDVSTIYNSDGNWASVRRLVEKYDVKYIIVGPLEHAYYPPAGLAKFDDAVDSGDLNLVYDSDGVKIYEYLQPGSN